MEVSKLKDGRVHVRNSGVKGLMFSIKVIIADIILDTSHAFLHPQERLHRL